MGLGGTFSGCRGRQIWGELGETRLLGWLPAWLFFHPPLGVSTTPPRIGEEGVIGVKGPGGRGSELWQVK